MTPRRRYSTDLTDAQWAILERWFPPSHPGGARPGTLFPRLRHLGVDAGYSGKGAEWVRAVLGWTVEVVKRSQRWV